LLWFPLVWVVYVYIFGCELIVSDPMHFNNCNFHFISQKKPKPKKTKTRKSYVEEKKSKSFCEEKAKKRENEEKGGERGEKLSDWHWICT